MLLTLELVSVEIVGKKLAAWCFDELDEIDCEGEVLWIHM